MRREMDCSECILLIFSFCCAGGMSSGSEKTVYGSLGGSTLLSITPEFQNFTLQFRKAVWKLNELDGGTKKSTFLARYCENNYTIHKAEQFKFHPENFSFEILKTRRAHAGHYEYTVNKGFEEQSLQFQLEVYEQVSIPNIQMVSKALVNESCTMNLSCVVMRGDNVTYSWNCSEGNTSQLHPYNDSFLHLSFTPEEDSISCTCTARNKVSQQATTFSSSVECSNKPGGLLRNELLESIVPIAIVGVLVLCAGVTYWLRHKGQKEHSQLKEEKESCTIYSQVQRVEQKSSRPPPAEESSECTTIYVSATGQPPDSTQPQDPGLTTIYASVMPATMAQQQLLPRKGYNTGQLCAPPPGLKGATFRQKRAVQVLGLIQSPTSLWRLPAIAMTAGFVLQATTHQSHFTLVPEHLSGSPSGSSRAEAGAMKLSRILGDSVTFPLGISAEQIKTVAWTVNTSSSVVTVAAGNPPIVIVSDPSYEGRLTVPDNSNSLQITSLRMEDMGTYTAKISTAMGIIYKHFLLHVYKQMLKPTVHCDLVTCANKTCNYKLSCTVRDRGDQVTYSWTRPAGGAVVSNESILHISQVPRDAHLAVTCTAQNPVSNSSTTGSAKDLCAVATMPLYHVMSAPTTTTITESPAAFQSALTAGIAVPVIVVISLVIIVLWFVYIQRRKKALQKFAPGAAGSAKADEETNTVYAKVGNLPLACSRTGTWKGGPETKEDETKTIYSKIHNPNQSPLQTDDEKPCKEGPESMEKGEKTIYATVNQPTQTKTAKSTGADDSAAKPKSQATTEYDKITRSSNSCQGNTNMQRETRNN
ncbi:uncharacterized protein LOC119847586 [Dermochelys coriacea]|uniref:uncharacterized protein LOC119847586 n=1 Tax=Dermochelys coriacea TaxID=27794 RepID=UPI001CAA1B0E|nr:uncharacterized protein LOC119847586 [Dermochelys coriacea]